MGASWVIPIEDDGLRVADPDEDAELYSETFANIDDALEDGKTLQAWRSGGGLRCVVLRDEEGDSAGYGEHFHLSPALTLADAEYGDMDLDHDEKRYLTGATDAETHLDEHVVQGRDLYAEATEDGNVAMEVRGWDEDTVLLRTEQPTFTDAYQALNAVELPKDTVRLTYEGRWAGE